MQGATPVCGSSFCLRTEIAPLQTASYCPVRQVSLEEGAYRQQLPELQARLAAAGVRGVWEDRLPPELNAALALGCVAVVAPSARQRSLGAGFDLQELHMKPVAQVSVVGMK